MAFMFLLRHKISERGKFGSGTWIRTGDNAGMNRVL